MMTLTVNRVIPEILGWNLMSGAVARVARAIGTLDTWRQRQKSRSQFASLDARILKDSGISEAQRFIEGNKPFWEV